MRRRLVNVIREREKKKNLSSNLIPQFKNQNKCAFQIFSYALNTAVKKKNVC